MTWFPSAGDAQLYFAFLGGLGPESECDVGFIENDVQARPMAGEKIMIDWTAVVGENDVEFTHGERSGSDLYAIQDNVIIEIFDGVDTDEAELILNSFEP